MHTHRSSEADLQNWIQRITAHKQINNNNSRNSTSTSKSTHFVSMQSEWANIYTYISCVDKTSTWTIRYAYIEMWRLLSWRQFVYWYAAAVVLTARAHTVNSLSHVFAYVYLSHSHSRSVSSLSILQSLCRVICAF